MRPDDDLPEITDEMVERADLYHGDTLIKAGKGGPNPRVAQAIRQTVGRPRSEAPKLAIKLRIDPDVIEHFRATGPGWQTRINETLRRATRANKAPAHLLAKIKAKRKTGQPLTPDEKAARKAAAREAALKKARNRAAKPHAPTQKRA
jgi:uncharacterized protein (DUF4415 family)